MSEPIVPGPRLMLAIVSAAFLSIACSTVIADQESSDLVAQLSWASVGADHMAMTLWPKPVGPEADRLITIGKPATLALLSALRDPERAVAAHLILCSIWFDDRRETKEEPLYQGKEIVGFRYTVFGMVWSVNFRYPGDAPPPPEDDAPFDLAKQIERGKYAKTEYHVEISDLDRNATSWCTRLPRRYRGAC